MEGWLGSKEGPAGCKAQSTPSGTITKPGAAVLKGWSLVSGPAASPRSLLEMQIMGLPWQSSG